MSPSGILGAAGAQWALWSWPPLDCGFRDAAIAAWAGHHIQRDEPQLVADILCDLVSRAREPGNGQTELLCRIGQRLPSDDLLA